MDARVLVGRNLARVRAMRGLSQTQLAGLIDPAKLHIGQSYLSKIERGEKNVTILTLAIIAEALRVPIAELVADLDCEAAPDSRANA